jgi:hypothetical protein
MSVAVDTQNQHHNGGRTSARKPHKGVMYR